MASSQEIYAVVLAGGSGTRFWPASRRLRPKQVLPLGPSAPRSLIGATVERLNGLVDDAHVLVATGAHLVDATRRELPSLPAPAFLAEPQAKNTAPCIGWAASVIAKKNPDAIVCVLPSDQHAENDAEFRRVLSVAAESAAKGVITTIGIVPTRPETGYGYIRRSSEKSAGVFGVDAFVEKPDRDTAQKYVDSGEYLWNAGIFVFRAGDMMAAFEKHLPPMSALLAELSRASSEDGSSSEADVAQFFEACESVSIDYGIMEKESELNVVPGDFGWSDLGSWESSWELSPKDENQNAAPEGTIFHDAKGNLVEDLRTTAPPEGGRVIALVGVDDLCVVETDDGLLILPRERSQDVREVVAQLKNSGRTSLV